MRVVYERADGWWVARDRGVPGAHTQGRTKREARENLEEAVKLIKEANHEVALRGKKLSGLRPKGELCEFCIGCVRYERRSEPFVHPKGVVLLENVTLGVCDTCLHTYYPIELLREIEGIWTGETRVTKRTVSVLRGRAQKPRSAPVTLTP